MTLVTNIRVNVEPGATPADDGVSVSYLVDGRAPSVTKQNVQLGTGAASLVTATEAGEVNAMGSTDGATFVASPAVDGGTFRNDWNVAAGAITAPTNPTVNGGTGQWSLDKLDVDETLTLDAAGYLSHGASPATAGAVRLSTGDLVNWADGTSAVHEFLAENYGAVADYDTVTNATCTATSVVVSSPSNPWSATDVGKLVRVRYGGAAGAQLLTTIAAVNSPGSIDLAAAAGSSIVGTATVEWGTDNRAALQACLDAAIAVSGTVKLPPGGFMISGPLIIGGGLSAPRVTLEGTDSSGIAGTSTTIYAYDLDLPALIIQGSRGVRVAKLSIHGPAYEISDNIASGGLDSLVDDSTFEMAGLRSDDYSPNCCIAVDPFDPTVPVGNRYPGLGDYYVTSLKSTRIEIDTCGLRYAHTLIAWSCNGYPGNGESSVIQQCEMNVAVIGFHATSNQTNNVQLIGNSYTEMKYAICTMDIATWSRVGMPPRITHGIFGYCRYLFINGDHGLFVSKVQAEAFFAIGVFKGVSLNENDLIEASEFSLARSAAGLNTDFDIWASKLVNFKSCAFHVHDDDGVPVRVISNSVHLCASFDDCLFVSGSVSTRSALVAGTFQHALPLHRTRMRWSGGQRAEYNGELAPRSIEVAYSVPMTDLGDGEASFTGIAGVLAQMAAGDPVHVGPGGAVWTIPASEVPTDAGSFYGFVGTVKSIDGTTVTLQGLGKAAAAAADGVTNRRFYWTRAPSVRSSYRAEFLDLSTYPEEIIAFDSPYTVYDYVTTVRTVDTYGAVEVRLPDPTLHARRVIHVVANSRSSNEQLAYPTTVTSPTFTINRGSSVVLNWNNQRASFYSDGTEWWTLGHVRELEELVGSFTVAQLLAETPSPAPAGKIVYCSDETGGPTLSFSDGTNWRRVTDNAIVS